jgi:hypothetical protein
VNMLALGVHVFNLVPTTLHSTVTNVLGFTFWLLGAWPSSSTPLPMATCLGSNLSLSRPESCAERCGTQWLGLWRLSTTHYITLLITFVLI